MGTEDLVHRLMKCETAWASDAQGATNTMDPGIKPVWKGAKVAGQAFTVRCYPQSIITVHKALLEAKPGDVLVVDGGGDPTGAIFGEIMGLEALSAGIRGVIVDGAVRDIGELEREKLPVFARATTPRVGTNRRVGQLQVDVTCGGVVVHPGDYVLADEDGVVVIPRDRVEEIVAATEAVGPKEESMRQRMAAGEHLADILNLRSLM